MSLVLQNTVDGHHREVPRLSKLYDVDVSNVIRKLIMAQAIAIN